MKLPPAGAYAGPDPDRSVLEPQVFVRTLTAPSGLPWEQSRAAELEARMAAPAAMAALKYRMIRIEPWGFGKPGRFAAVYLRGGEGLAAYETEVLIEGRAVKVAFLSEAARRGRRLERLRAIVFAAAPLALVVAAVMASLGIAADREARIEALEVKAQRAELLAHRAGAQRAEAHALQGAGAEGRTLPDALRDLDWLSRARAPAAHVQAVHWENGLMTITVRGDAPPVRASEREVRRADKPLGTALWLWGVGPAAKGGGAQEDRAKGDRAKGGGS